MSGNILRIGKNKIFIGKVLKNLAVVLIKLTCQEEA